MGTRLAYRAFFALPESIATADGRPTNAIYGFASMMAKILIDHSPKARRSSPGTRGGRAARTSTREYKSQRKSRPDLLKEQWPHLAPLAEAFGLRQRLGRGLRGRRRDRHPRAPGVRRRDPGDDRLRRPRRLPAGRRRDPGDDHLARRHRHEGLRPRGRDRALRRSARAGHRLHRPQGRHLRQHPGRAGDRRQDRRAAAAAVRLARGRARHRSTRSRGRSGSRTSPSTPTTPGSRSSWRRWSRTSTCRSAITEELRSARPTARSCATPRTSSSCGR